MPRIHHQRASANPDPRLNRILWQWLTVGALSLALFPAARGDGLWLGWLPFWAVIAPLVSLLVLHRRALASAWRAINVPAPRPQRLRRTGVPTRRPGFGALPRRQAQKAA
jgi:hypothetical protein